MKKTDRLTRDDVLKLAAEHHLTFVACAFGYLKDWSGAEDVVQECYIIIGDKWEKYRAGSSIVAWCRSIIRFRCLEHNRIRRREYVTTNEHLVFLMDYQLDRFSENASPERMESQIQALTKCISTLKPRSQKLIQEFYVKGRMSKDIAKEEGRKEQSALMHLWRLRTRLRNCMKGQSETESFEKPSDVERFCDDFFTVSPTDQEQITNFLESQKTGLGLAPYLEEWAVFATAVSRVFEKKNQAQSKCEETLDGNSLETLSNKAAIDEVVEMDIVSNVRPFSDNLKKIYYLVGMAACIGLSVLLWYGFISSSNNNYFAEVVSGEALIGGEEFSVSSGTTVLAGETVKVEAGQSCIITLVGEDSTFAISGPSEFTFSDAEAGKGKGLDIASGEILVNLAKQPSGKAFELQTSQAVIKVLGTRFRLKANPSSTSISLESGRLLLRQRNSGKEEFMLPGQKAVIDSQSINLRRMEVNVADVMFKDNYSAFYDNPIYMEGLVFWGRFDEGQGTVITDSSGNYGRMNIHNLNSTMENLWVDGPIGKALYLGSNSGMPPQITCPDFSNFLNGETFSFLFWLNVESKENGTVRRQSMFTCANWSQNKQGIQLDVKCDNDGTYTLRFFRKYDSVKHHPDYPHQVRINQDEWNHIALTHDNGSYKCYVDGQLKELKEFTPAAIVMPDSKELFVGPYHSQNNILKNNIFIDNLAIFNRAVSAKEIEDSLKL